MTATARTASKFGGKYGKWYTGRRPSSTDWLQILDSDGPFLAAPIVSRAPPLASGWLMAPSLSSSRA